MSLPQKPIGKINLVAAGSITAGLPTTSAGVKVITKEIFRTRWIKISNKTNQPVVVRMHKGTNLDIATGEVSISELLLDNNETNNYKEMLIDVDETIYLHKDPGQTPLNPNPADPMVPEYITTLSEGQQGELIAFVHAGTAPTTGNVYVSPIAVFG